MGVVTFPLICVVVLRSKMEVNGPGVPVSELNKYTIQQQKHSPGKAVA